MWCDSLNISTAMSDWFMEAYASLEGLTLRQYVRSLPGSSD